MSNFKPSVTFTTDESRRDYANRGYRGRSYILKRYDTYRELKKNLKQHLEDSENHTVSVSRSKRGEWGEWFEDWGLNSERKPIVKKEGWM